MLRTAQLLPPTGLSTLGFDPARFQTEPPACYRASWQLPGRDSHSLAATSLCSDQVNVIAPPPNRWAHVVVPAEGDICRLLDSLTQVLTPSRASRFVVTKRRSSRCVTPSRV